MIEIRREHIEAYLKRRYGESVRVLRVGDIGTLDEQGMKRFGYGKPVRIQYEVDGRTQDAVLSVMRGDKYGHQFYWDRAAVLLFQYDAGQRMKKHVAPLGVGYLSEDDQLIPVEAPREFFIVNEFVDGYDYFKDLVRIQREGVRESDLAMARRLAGWLAEVHSEKPDDPDLYYRRVRDLLGSSECIMGLIDEAFPHPYEGFSDQDFIALEKRLIDWRWKLRTYAHRLCAVHGDFHPWNVLVTDDGEFHVLDRSRGEWGDAAGDVICMAVNYLLFGIAEQTENPTLKDDFLKLYETFIQEYLVLTGDEEMFEVMAPFFVFRCLVITSPEWYPNHPPAVRAALLRIMRRAVEDDVFQWRRINDYMESS